MDHVDGGIDVKRIKGYYLGEILRSVFKIIIFMCVLIKYCVYFDNIPK